MSNLRKRIVVKIGSNVLTQANGLPDVGRISHLVEQIVSLKTQNLDVILVSSGAVASGRSLIKLDEKNNPVGIRQLLASIGQVRLIQTYANLFENYQILCSQVLVTKEDFRDRTHYLNMKNCLEMLLQHDVIPIINENDVVSVTELMFTDNDELAGLVAAMLNVDELLILSNVDGIYDGDPKLESSKIIEQIDEYSQKLSTVITATKSNFGRGGMLTKTNMAQKTAQLGIRVRIANGTKDDIILNVLSNAAVHTQFVPHRKASGKKKWIAHAENAAKGTVTINEGAKQVLCSKKAYSLLPVGIVHIDGDFRKGDIIRILDADGLQTGLGIAEYGADKARERVGQRKQKALVHYDYLYLSI